MRNPWGSPGSYACIHGWMYTDVYGIWLVVYFPLWKKWLRQLGWWHSQLNGKIQFMFQTTNQVYTGYEWLWPTVFICFLSAGSASGQNYLIICWGFNPNQWRPVSSCPEVHLKFHMALAQPNLDLLNPCHKLEHMLGRFWFVDCRGSLQQIQEMSGSSHEQTPFIIDFPMIFPWFCHDFPMVFPLKAPSGTRMFFFISPHRARSRQPQALRDMSSGVEWRHWYGWGIEQ